MPTITIRATLEPSIPGVQTSGSIRIYFDLEVDQDLYDRYEGLGYTESEAREAALQVENMIEDTAAKLIYDGLIVRDWYNTD